MRTRGETGGRPAVLLTGGLGNQLFQWALANALVDKGRRVDLDVGLVCRQPRPLVIRELCTDFRLRTAPSAGITPARLVRAPRTLSGYRRVVEPHFNYWPGVFEVDGRCLVEGYWQSPRYFASVADDIRSRATAYCDEQLTEEGRNLLAQIRHDPGAVSVHVRRTDYVTHRGTSALLGFVGLEYYRRALAEMSTRGAGTYYVFGDDLAWAARHLQGGGNVQVVPRTAALGAGGDMALMAACSGHVIVNSSFSWWGAWLDADPSLGVIAPSPWFLDRTMATVDLMPASWLQLDRGERPEDRPRGGNPSTR